MQISIDKLRMQISIDKLRMQISIHKLRTIIGMDLYDITTVENWDILRVFV